MHIFIDDKDFFIFTRKENVRLRNYHKKLLEDTNKALVKKKKKKHGNIIFWEL